MNVKLSARFFILSGDIDSVHADRVAMVISTQNLISSTEFIWDVVVIAKPTINNNFLLSQFYDVIYHKEKWWQPKSAWFNQKLCDIFQSVPLISRLIFLLSLRNSMKECERFTMEAARQVLMNLDPTRFTTNFNVNMTWTRLVDVFKMFGLWFSHARVVQLVKRQNTENIKTINRHPSIFE